MGGLGTHHAPDKPASADFSRALAEINCSLALSQCCLSRP